MPCSFLRGACDPFLSPVERGGIWCQHGPGHLAWVLECRVVGNQEQPGQVSASLISACSDCHVVGMWWSRTSPGDRVTEPAQDRHPSSFLNDLGCPSCPCCWLSCSAVLCQVHYRSNPKKPAVNYILKTCLHTSLSLAPFHPLKRRNHPLLSSPAW